MYPLFSRSIGGRLGPFGQPSCDIAVSNSVARLGELLDGRRFSDIYGLAYKSWHYSPNNTTDFRPTLLPPTERNLLR